MQKFTVEGKKRDTFGKDAAKRSRRIGLVPAVLYGGRGDSLPLDVNAKQVARILRSETGHNSIVTVLLAGGGEENAILKDWQVDPVSGSLLHVDMLRVAMDVRMRFRVPVHPFGEPEGVKLQGGIFEIVTREVAIECLPGDIPEEFRVDVTGLTLHKQLRASDLPLDHDKMKLVSDPQRVLAHVVALKKEEEPAPEAVAAAAATPVEPEVIKKGKKEVEEGEEGAEPEKPAKGKEK